MGKIQMSIKLTSKIGFVIHTSVETQITIAKSGNEITRYLQHGDPLLRKSKGKAFDRRWSKPDYGH